MWSEASAPIRSRAVSISVNVTVTVSSPSWRASSEFWITSRTTLLSGSPLKCALDGSRTTSIPSLLGANCHDALVDIQRVLALRSVWQ